MVGSCLNCIHWPADGPETSGGARWCRNLQTWTTPGFFCKDFTDMPMHDSPGEWYTVEEVAGRACVSPSTVRYWIQVGKLKAFPDPNLGARNAGQFTTRWRIDKEVAEKYLAWYVSTVSRSSGG